MTLESSLTSNFNAKSFKHLTENLNSPSMGFLFIPVESANKILSFNLNEIFLLGEINEKITPESSPGSTVSLNVATINDKKRLVNTGEAIVILQKIRNSLISNSSNPMKSIYDFNCHLGSMSKIRQQIELILSAVFSYLRRNKIAQRCQTNRAPAKHQLFDAKTNPYSISACLWNSSEIIPSGIIKVPRLVETQL